MDMEELMKRVNRLEEDNTMLSKKVIKLEKYIKKQVKEENSDKPKRQSIFTVPVKISSELCEFLEVPEGTELSRVDVTRKIKSYVDAHSLANPSNKQEINADAALKKILGVDSTTWLKLQTHLKRHYPSSKGQTVKEEVNEEPKVEEPPKKKVVKKVVKK